PEEGEPGPGIDFATAFPEPATYRLFLDFQVDGRVHDATFVQQLEADGPDGMGGHMDMGGDEGDEHDH
ncbi:MAG TPA: heavy-metal-associated domain-containing protein, partial [Nocardioides sp.]|nr:heavy-metal-associated domain-containing protein [Nocardioides sp.]